MATLISAIETKVRLRLNETTALYWSSAELVGIISDGARDLWRDTVDLKAEHYFTRDATNVSMAANGTTLTGVPADIHKVYLIEPRDTSESSSNRGVFFKPLEYNDQLFRSARSQSAVEPSDCVIYYSVTGQGSPVAAPTIYVAPKITSAMNLTFVYVPTLGDLTAASNVPIPGEADSALVAWTVAFARAKERDDRSPDPRWLEIYGTEKQHLLQSLGLRQLQEPTYVKALFEDYWG